MNKNKVTLIFMAFAMLPTAVTAADAQSIIDKVLELQDERRKGVNRYVVEQSVMGHATKVIFERTTVTGPDGKPVETFRMVLPEQYSGYETDSPVTREDFDNMAEDSLRTIDDIAGAATLVGTEAVDSKKAYHLVATDLNREQDFGDGGSFTLQTVSVWIDTDKYVPLKMTMAGMLDIDGAARPMTMEMLNLDYRDVPGSNMYESYKQVMRMNGVMSDETKQQVEQARVQLAEFEKQLAEMPQSQRDMMMSMMGDRIEMMRKLAAGEGLEITTEVVSITVE